MTPEDVPAAHAAAVAALARFYPTDEARRESAQRGHQRVAHLQRTDPGGAWVAEDGGAVVGCALALVREGVWGLSLLGVQPEHQSRGIGRELLEAALGYAEDLRGAIILSTTDPRAMRRYARAGFDLRPCVSFAGIVDRSGAPGGLRARRGDVGADRELCDAASRHVRGAAHGVDLAAARDAGWELLVHDDGGFALVRNGSPALLAAVDEAIARDLLWSALAAAPRGGSVDIDFLTAGQDWAVQVCLEAGLALSPDGPVFTRGDVGPFRPYIPNGAYL